MSETKRTTATTDPPAEAPAAEAPPPVPAGRSVADWLRLVEQVRLHGAARDRERRERWERLRRRMLDAQCRAHCADHDEHRAEAHRLVVRINDIELGHQTWAEATAALAPVGRWLDQRFTPPWQLAFFRDLEDHPDD